MSILIDRRRLIGTGLLAAVLPACVTLPATRRDLSWRKLPTVEYRGKQDDIAFGSPSRGWYGNGEGRLYRTDDGGDSWSEIWRKPGTFVRAMGFIDDQVGILGNVGMGAFPHVEDRIPLYRTTDGGVTWMPVASIDGPMPEGICAIDIQRYSTIDRGNRAEVTVVHAGGRVGGPAHYLRSNDDGLTWTSRDLAASTAAIFDVKFIGPRVGFLAGTTSPDLSRAGGLILRTADGGETWREVFRSRRPFETVWKIHFPTLDIGYATIQSYDPDSENAGRWVAKTVDAGRTWTELALINEPRWRSFGIGFADDRLGWVGGTIGGLETRDGGRSWNPVEMGRAINKIRFVENGARRRAYAIGSEIYRLDL